jgi:predicted nucleic acid-binding protein
MRTTLDIPEELIEEARRLLGFKSKTGSVILSLRADPPPPASCPPARTHLVIAVDTSVWIAFFRGPDRRTPVRHRDLLDADAVGLPAPVRVELLSGTSRAEFPRLRRLLAALPVGYWTAATWLRIDRCLEVAVARGESFGAGNLLIASLAAKHRWALWSLDHDFVWVARLGWVELHAPS